MANVPVKGLAELHRTLQQLPAKVERNILRGGLRAGAKVLQKAAQANVSVKRGDLRSSIKIKASSKRGRVHATVVAGGKDAPHAIMVELGTAAHMIAPTKKEALAIGGQAREVVHHPGARPHPYMRPALDQNAQPAVQATGDYVRRRLAKGGHL